jgi:hypothetical protein
MELVTTPSFFKQLYQFDKVYYPQIIDGFKVWILVAYPNENILPESNLAFLQKILGALRLSHQDFKIANVLSEGWKDYRQDSPILYKQVWVFDVSLQAYFPEIPILPAYEPNKVGEISYLQAESLEVLQNDVERKKQLWNALQKM